MQMEKVGIWYGPWSGQEYDVIIGRNAFTGWFWQVSNGGTIESKRGGFRTKREALRDMEKFRSDVKFSS